MRLPHTERIRGIQSSLSLASAYEFAKGNGPHSHAHAIEQLAAGEKTVFEIRGVMGHGGILKRCSGQFLIQTMIWMLAIILKCDYQDEA